MQKIEDNDELFRLHHIGVGLLYNDYSRHGAGGDKYNILHTAGCRTLKRADAKFDKYHFDTLTEATRWLHTNRGVEGIGWKRCGTCHASPPED